MTIIAPGTTDAAWNASIASHTCQYCGCDDGYWEQVYTGNEESQNGWEDWFCCHSCRNVGQPCETFFHISIDYEIGTAI